MAGAPIGVDVGDIIPERGLGCAAGCCITVPGSDGDEENCCGAPGGSCGCSRGGCGCDCVGSDPPQGGGPGGSGGITKGFGVLAAGGGAAALPELLRKLSVATVEGDADIAQEAAVRLAGRKGCARPLETAAAEACAGCGANRVGEIGDTSLDDTPRGIISIIRRRASEVLRRVEVRRRATWPRVHDWMRVAATLAFRSKASSSDIPFAIDCIDARLFAPLGFSRLGPPRLKVKPGVLRR